MRMYPQSWQTRNLRPKFACIATMNEESLPSLLANSKPDHKGCLYYIYKYISKGLDMTSIVTAIQDYWDPNKYWTSVGLQRLQDIGVCYRVEYQRRGMSHAHHTASCLT